MLRHRGVIQTATLGIALSFILTMQPAPMQQAYLLQRSPARMASSSSKRIVMQKHSPRITTTSRTTPVRVAQIGSSSSHETVRPAAPASRAIVVRSSDDTRVKPVTTSLSQSSSSSFSSSSFSSFPAFGSAVHPVSRIPNWGDMRSPAEWNRSYEELEETDFVPVPAYDLDVLTVPMKELLEHRNDSETIRILTAKLYYSTRHFSAYDVDSGEFSSDHPGIDLKLAEGTPAGAVAGGKVHDVRREKNGLGLHIIIEHRAPDGLTYYSVYGHLASAIVSAGDSVTSGQMIGTVGTTGFTTGPHIHLQIDLGEPSEASHIIYMPAHTPSRTEAARNTINPIEFIQKY